MWSCHTDLIVSLLMNMCWVSKWQTLYHMNPFSSSREYALVYTYSMCVCVCAVQLRSVFQLPNLLEYLVVWHINLPTADQIALAIPHHSQPGYQRCVCVCECACASVCVYFAKYPYYELSCVIISTPGWCAWIWVQVSD